MLFRPTTRVCHACASIELSEERVKVEPEGFVKDPKWGIFPRLSYLNHLKIEERNPKIGDEFSDSPYNVLKGEGRLGIVAGGISWAYAEEAAFLLGVSPRMLKVGTPFPFPEKLALQFLQGVDRVLVVEELDPVLERELIFLCGKHHLPVEILGKLSGHMPQAGENTVESVKKAMASFLSVELSPEEEMPLPQLPVRPPVLCAGCPHRASFYAVKQAMKGQKAIFCGDIGCYTLGNAKPLDMVDTCLCMGADLTIAQGLHRAEPGTRVFSFIGDSTFFASGMTGVVNAVYNEHDLTMIVLDNSTTAMTGHQPHPGTGVTMMGEISQKVSIPAVLTAIGVKSVVTVDPLDLDAAVKAVREAAGVKGVSAVIFKSPCIAVTKPAPAYHVDSEKCVGCQRCIRELGCPAVCLDGKKAAIEPSLCYGCSLCAQVCPAGAIVKEVE